jgi:hypothetical protein
MKRKLILLNGSIILETILFLFSCNGSNKQNGNESNVLEDSLKASIKKEIILLDDFILFSKAKYGFVKNDGTINEYYGDFDFISTEKSLFDFNVGCGSKGDIISVIIKTNNSKSNCFDIYIPEGNKYYGEWANSNIKVGELEVISENEIHGKIKLCMEEGSGCCGEEGENFILKKISTTTEPLSNSKKGFTIKKYKDLPSWFEKTDRTYMLNDVRIVENELVEYIGGYVPNKGEIFFIDNTEVVFPENQIKIDKIRTVITKTLTSGQYTIKITWDTELTTGEYSEGKINLYNKNVSIFNSPLIISGW